MTCQGQNVPVRSQKDVDEALGLHYAGQSAFVIRLVLTDPEEELDVAVLHAPRSNAPSAMGGDAGG